MKTHDEKLAELRAASAALASEKARRDAEIDARISAIKGSGFCAGIYVVGGDAVGPWANVTGVALMVAANLTMPLFHERK